MKWKYFFLAETDLKAKKQILESLEMGAHQKHTLTNALLSRYSNAKGPMTLIAFESLDVDAAGLYRYGTYCGGKSLPEVPGWESVTWMDSPRWGLVEFVDKHLLTSDQAVVLCENWAATRKDVSDWPRESRLLLYHDEVYHVLTKKDASSADSIECALRESEHHWATGVCSLCPAIPEGEIVSPEFFDGIVANTSHIFTPALDGAGYLVWSPRI